MDTLSLTKVTKIHNGEKTISLKSGEGKTGQVNTKEWAEQSITLYKAINSKWIKTKM